MERWDHGRRSCCYCFWRVIKRKGKKEWEKGEKKDELSSFIYLATRWPLIGIPMVFTCRNGRIRFCGARSRGCTEDWTCILLEGDYSNWNGDRHKVVKPIESLEWCASVAQRNVKPLPTIRLHLQRIEVCHSTRLQGDGQTRSQKSRGLFPVFPFLLVGLVG